MAARVLFSVGFFLGRELHFSSRWPKRRAFDSSRGLRGLRALALRRAQALDLADGETPEVNGAN